MGYQDLDLRPPEMERSTLGYTISECPDCRSVQYTESVQKVDLSFIKSAKYKGLSDADLPELANRFQRLGAIYEDSGDNERAAIAYLRAAWGCDDHKLMEKAVEFRLKSCELHIATPLTKDMDNVTIHAVCVDQYRRAQEFTSALKLAQEILDMLSLNTGEENTDMIRKILSFQKDKCLEKDDACYTVGDALNQ